LADLLTELRTALTNLHTRNGDTVPYTLTAAVGAVSAANPKPYKVPQMNTALDYWHLMAYDYAGDWSRETSHQANLYGGTLNTDGILNWYRSQRATLSKFTLGMPVYGHIFRETDGLGHPFRPKTPVRSN
jgi:chitinase